MHADGTTHQYYARHIHVIPHTAVRVRGIQLGVVAIDHAALRQLEVVQMDLVVLLEQVLSVLHGLSNFALLAQQFLIVAIPAHQFRHIYRLRDTTREHSLQSALSVNEFAFVSVGTAARFHPVKTETRLADLLGINAEAKTDI